MDKGVGFLLAVCGGGNNTAATIGAFVVFGLWGLAVWALIWVDTLIEERLYLFLLLAASALIGALIFLLPEGLSGDGDYLGRFFLAMLVPIALGIGTAAVSRQFGAARAIGISCAGAILIPGGIFLLFFASVAVGTGCLD